MTRAHYGVLCVALLTVSANGAQGQEAGREPLDSAALSAVLRFFDYDKTVPLDARVVATDRIFAASRERVVFRGVAGGQVPGFLAIPEDHLGRVPLVVLMHAGASSKDSWWSEGGFEHGALLVRALLAAGFAVFALDAQYHGERTAGNGYVPMGTIYFQNQWWAMFRDITVESTRDYRRALDYLATRPELDLSRIGVVGQSMGSLMTFQLAAAEPRVTTIVAGVPALSEPWLYPLTGINLSAGLSGRAILMLVAAKDELIPATDSDRLFAILEGPANDRRVFDSGHRLPTTWVEPAVAWLRTHLKREEPSR